MPAPCGARARYCRCAPRPALPLQLPASGGMQGSNRIGRRSGAVAGAFCSSARLPHLRPACALYVRPTTRLEWQQHLGRTCPPAQSLVATPRPAAADLKHGRTKSSGSRGEALVAGASPPAAPDAVDELPSSSSEDDGRAAARAEAKAAALATYTAGGSNLRTKRPPGLVKRTVAIHLGYIGTAFRGR